MESSPKPHDRKKRAINELVRGRDLAHSLQLSLKKSSSLLSSTHNQDLVTKIMGSFSEVLGILDSSLVDDQSHVGNKSEDSTSGESCKPLPHTSKERRGSYNKRRKTSETWSKESSSLIDDGHAWRKYGQKSILHADHPRNYFRCTHKFDQGCQASKQVQMIQEDPPLYLTTYHGHHTCRNLHKAPQIILDNTTITNDCSILLSFDQSINQKNILENKNVINHDNLIAEMKEEVHQSLFQNQTDHYFFPGDLTMGPMSSALSAGSDYGETISSGVYSCSTSSTRNNWGMDHHLEIGNDFDDVLQFEF